MQDKYKLFIYISLLVWKNAKDKAHMAFAKMKKNHSVVVVCFRLVKFILNFDLNIAMTNKKIQKL